ncbi:MAG: M13 family metallopeptidase, partial [Pyrinomonadaceae bacterium]|nr:M13 family metallopeptidase [Pyrinomonadaceae bacterium]
MRLTFLRKFGAGLALVAFASTTFAQTVAFDTTRMDKSEQACNDFFRYANGTYLKKTEIPADRSRVGSFDILADSNRAILYDILEAEAKLTNSPKGSDAQLIGDFYASCMDEAGIEKAGISPIKAYFSRIKKVRNAKDLQAAIANLHNDGIPTVFGFDASPDLKNAGLNIAGAGQGGLSLPNRDYYTKTDDPSVKIRNQFVQYATNMFQLAGDKPEVAKANAEAVLRFQTRLATASKAPVELREPEKNYHKTPIADADKLTPNFSWTTYVKQRNAPVTNVIDFGQPEFFAEVNKMVSDVSLGDWKNYLKWSVLNASAGRLPKKFADENFDFYSRKLRGVKEQEVRWKRCTAATDRAVGEALGQEYVKRAFTPVAKQRMDELITNLFAAYGERIGQLDWMSDETKKEALLKLSTFQRKIGFPDKLRGYEGLNLSRKSYFDNSREVARFLTARELKDIQTPVDKTRWGMTPPTVNAYYNPLYNEIVFPAGILQPPFFNANADDAINYGSIGAVIGHEITHGFDDQGSQFDSTGNLRMWWTKDDRSRFTEKASCVSTQFSGYEVDPGLFMNGKLTLGENIADLGGLTMAYAAFQKSMEGKTRPADIDGFTPEQRFFLGYAQVWASKARPEAVRVQVATDPHAIAEFRVNGPLSNLPQFSEAFGCKMPDKMIS